MFQLLESIKKGNQLLYVVDIADYTPQIDLWDYKLVTDSYAGESLTFLVIRQEMFVLC